MKTFTTFENVQGLKPCIKKPIVVHAMQIDEDFVVKVIEGTDVKAKAGTYLMKGVKGELYPCDKESFKQSYDFIGE